MKSCASKKEMGKMIGKSEAKDKKQDKKIMENKKSASKGNVSPKRIADYAKKKK